MNWSGARRGCCWVLGGLSDRKRADQDRDREHARSISLDEQGLKLNRSRASLSPDLNAPKQVPEGTRKYGIWWFLVGVAPR